MKFPRQHRFVLAAAIQRTAFAFQERIIEASLGKAPGRSLEGADVALAKLRFYLRLCRDLELLGDRRYGYAARQVDEVGRLLGGWRQKQSAENR